MPNDHFRHIFKSKKEKMNILSKRVRQNPLSKLLKPQQLSSEYFFEKKRGLFIGLEKGARLLRADLLV
ncbi:hypothetical protein CJZ71_07025 [Bacillus subtilis]|nr:hypothetical protein A4A60_17065 [Bacillus subtilis]ARW32957.1 hypothetical protein S101441_03437 [Bacillus subtilis subsp. subtilis]ASB71295.1 hypothetical protein S100333_03431 [Bacillus subtilis subsp. subtilis]ASV01947.1 hypothetical protein CJZ71_07025 [Bacillus subtilis]AYK71969.1 hypothetical protein D9C09_20780 [Bacillus subtilis subsp. subtilis]